MRSTIGGRQLEITRQEVSRRMKHVEPEPARQHEVLVDGVWFPPKQVLALVAGREGSSFTTQEAQRTL